MCTPRKRQNYLTREQYNTKFKDNHTRAYVKAIQFRSFEIDLYWKRAAYFWGFIAATFAGFFAIQETTTNGLEENFSILISCLGVVFSCAWLCVNKGSKFWQENWENHIDMLEDTETGPLYKTILYRSDPENCCDKIRRFVTGPSQFSVSKINLLLSWYIFIIWVGILLYSANNIIEQHNHLGWWHIAIISLTAITCILFIAIGKTGRGVYKHVCKQRISVIRKP